MNKAALNIASDHLARAKSALQAMENAQTLQDMETGWSDFLVAANRVFAKLEQGAKTNGQSSAWFRRKKHDRSTNPVLRYVHQARNADEHGILRVTGKEPGGIALGVGPGTWRFDGSLDGRMKVTALGGQVPGGSKFVEVIPPRVRLIRVYNRRVPYDPPTEAPTEAAQQTIDYLEKMLGEARELPE